MKNRRKIKNKRDENFKSKIGCASEFQTYEPNPNRYRTIALIAQPSL